MPDEHATEEGQRNDDANDDGDRLRTQAAKDAEAFEWGRAAMALAT
jgi:hypothetical protein